MSEKYTTARITSYQWVYVYAPHEDTGVITLLPYAQWDETMGAWLVGFSIYLTDSSGTVQSYDIPFPVPVPEPIPASNYNPLGL